MDHKKKYIYCSTVEKAPPKRVDVNELFLTQLAQKDVRQVWFCKAGCNGNGEMVKHSENAWLITPRNFTGKHLWIRLLNYFSYLFCDALNMLKNANDISIYIIRDKYISTIPAYFLSRLFRRKFVVWCSYPFPEHDLAMAKKEKGAKGYFLIVRSLLGKMLYYRWAMSRADHVFVQSKQMLKDLEEYGVPECKMTPVPMGIADSFFEQCGQNMIKKNVQGRVVYLGTLASIRHLGTIIRAFSKVVENLPHASLLMIGDGDKPYEREILENEVKRLGLDKHVIFTGFIPINEAWSYVSTAEVCLSPILPSKVLNAGSPTKIVEYLAAGKPVVANNQAEQIEVIEESKAGICVEWCEDSFAEAIIELLLNPQKALEMGSRGPDWVKQNRLYSRIAEDVFVRLKLIADEKRIC